MTIEDPIEMVHEEFNQIAANPKTGTGFAEALRHVLRQDPDVIMVGEVRDAETATQAVQAALTGHLVLTTLHTSDAVGAVARLRDLGVPGFLIAATLTGVVAQRLVRGVCPNCAEDVLAHRRPGGRAGRAPPRGARRASSSPGAALGCPKCRYTGYFGRTGIFEILAVNHRLRHLIAEGGDPRGAGPHRPAGRAAHASRARRPQGGVGGDLLRGGHALHRRRGGAAMRTPEAEIAELWSAGTPHPLPRHRRRRTGRWRSAAPPPTSIDANVAVWSSERGLEPIAPEAADPRRRHPGRR